MTTWTRRALGATLLLAAPALLAVAGIRQERIQFAAGATAAKIEGRLQGDEGVDYLVRARAGQKMTVALAADHTMAYFNVLPPGSEEAMFVGSVAGARLEGELPADGDYTVRVYLLRAAARRGESAKFTLDVAVTGGPAPNPAGPSAAAAAHPFDRELDLLGVTFRVISPNRAAGNRVEITTAGLTIDNSPWQHEIEGVVTGAEVGDINADQSPEIYVYVTGTGEEAHGSLVAYSANRKKSLSAIYLPELSAHPGATEGYRGHDEMAVVEGILARRFPIFGADGKPTGRMRQLQYKLAPGEAGWTLRLDRMIEF
jgi:hypothetical protein